jgi:hypothetical protein
MTHNEDNKINKISDEEMAEISLGFHQLYNQLQKLKAPRKTAPQLLQELLAQNSDRLNDFWFDGKSKNEIQTKLTGTLIKSQPDNCDDCGESGCEHCDGFVQEEKPTCDCCNTHTPDVEESQNNDAWNAARNYYKTVYEKSVAKMTADQNYARIINEKFENERFQGRTQREYENALVALDNAKEKYERSLECTPLLNKRLQEAEKKKAKAHEEYEWICNNAPKR